MADITSTWFRHRDEISPPAGLRGVDAGEGRLLPAGAYQDHLEGAQVAVSVHVVLVVSCSAEHRSVGGDPICDELRRNGDAAEVAGDRVEYKYHTPRPVDDEDASVAAP